MDPLLVLAAAAEFVVKQDAEHVGKWGRDSHGPVSENGQNSGLRTIGTVGSVGSIIMEHNTHGVRKCKYADVSPAVIEPIEPQLPCVKKKCVYVKTNRALLPSEPTKTRLTGAYETKHAATSMLLGPETQAYLLNHKGIIVPLSKKYTFVSGDIRTEGKGQIPEAGSAVQVAPNTAHTSNNTLVDLDPDYKVYVHAQQREIFVPAVSTSVQDENLSNGMRYMRNQLRLLEHNTLSMTVFRKHRPQQMIVGQNYVHWDNGDTKITHSYQLEVYSSTQISEETRAFMNPGELVKQLSKDLMCGLVGGYVNTAESGKYIPRVHNVTVLIEDKNWSQAVLSAQNTPNAATTVSTATTAKDTHPAQVEGPGRYKLAHFMVNLGLHCVKEMTYVTLQRFVIMSALKGLVHHKWLLEVKALSVVLLVKDGRRITKVVLGPDGQIVNSTARPRDVWQPASIGTVNYEQAHTFADRRKLFLTVIGPHLLQKIGGPPNLFEAKNLSELNTLHRSELWGDWLNYYRKVAYWVSAGFCSPEDRDPELSLASYNNEGDGSRDGRLMFPQCLVGQEFVPFQYVFDPVAQPVTVAERIKVGKLGVLAAKSMTVKLAYTYWIARAGEGVAGNK